MKTIILLAAMAWIAVVQAQDTTTVGEVKAEECEKMISEARAGEAASSNASHDSDDGENT